MLLLFQTVGGPNTHQNKVSAAGTFSASFVTVWLSYLGCFRADWLERNLKNPANRGPAYQVRIHSPSMLLCRQVIPHYITDSPFHDSQGHSWHPYRMVSHSSSAAVQGLISKRSLTTMLSPSCTKKPKTTRHIKVSDLVIAGLAFFPSADLEWPHAWARHPDPTLPQLHPHRRARY